MAKKLTFLSIIVQRKWSLLYKTLLWSATLFLTALTGFWWLSLVVFFFVSLGIYFSEPPERRAFQTTYWFFSFSVFGLLCLQTASLNLVFASFWASLLIIIIAGIVFAGILGMFRFSFINEPLAYSIINTVLFITLFIDILALAAPFSLGAAGLLLFIVLTLLFRENLLFLKVSPKQSILIGMVLGFLGLELTWVILLLPLGIINSAALLTLFFILIRDFLSAHFRGILSSSFIFRQLTFLVLFTIIILASSKWSL